MCLLIVPVVLLCFGLRLLLLIAAGLAAMFWVCALFGVCVAVGLLISMLLAGFDYFVVRVYCCFDYYVNSVGCFNSLFQLF